MSDYIEDRLTRIEAAQQRIQDGQQRIQDGQQRIQDGQTQIKQRLDLLLLDHPEPSTPDQPDEPTPSGPLTVQPLPGVPIADVLPIAAGWTLSLPIPKPGTTPADSSPWNDYPDKLTGGAAPGMAYPALVGGRRAVVFDVANPSAGVTTSGSKYPRSELREMIDGQRWEEAARSSGKAFTCTAELAIITSGLTTRKRVVGWQIHGGDDDVCQLIADEQGRLGISWRDGDAWLTLRERYAGEPVRLRVDSLGKVPDAAGRLVQGPIRISIDGQPAVQIAPGAGSGWYVKAGAYVQTGGRSTYREPATAVGRVIYWSLDVQPRA